jgi:hypothetical protein
MHKPRYFNNIWQYKKVSEVWQGEEGATYCFHKQASDALHNEQAAGLMKVFRVHHVMHISHGLKLSESNISQIFLMRTFSVDKGMMERVG